MKKSLFFLSTFIVFFSSCHKEPTTFSGITYRDDMGNSVASVDADDWNLNDNWNSRERGLFGSSNNTLCSSNSNNLQIVGFPNPTPSSFELVVINIGSAQSLSVRIVNQNFDVLASRDTVLSGHVYINLRGIVTSNQIVRAYYKIVGNGCEYRGHGDVEILLN